MKYRQPRRAHGPPETEETTMFLPYIRRSGNVRAGEVSLTPEVREALRAGRR